MSIMILAHPRSRSTLMANCFNNYLGEVFNLGNINKNTFELEPMAVNLDINWTDSWNEPWAQDYLRFIEKRLAAPDAVFKLFLGQICGCPQIFELIQRVNPKVFTIERKDKLSAIKSVMIAERRGFSKVEQHHAEPFTVSLAEFTLRYRQIVMYPRLWSLYFNIDWSTNYEEFNPVTFPFAQKKPELQNQNSAESYHLIQNEKQIDNWFNLLKVSHANHDM